MTTVLAVAGLVAGTWLLAVVRVPGRPAGTGPGRAAPAVSVVVPARDEAASLPGLLVSLARLEPPPAEVLVVDDGSTDATAALARAGGATVLTAPPPPAGWLGKPWACHLGAEAAAGEHMLFLDADTRLAPDALGRLLATLPAGGLLSVQPFHEVVRPHEQLSAVPNLVAMMGSAAFTPIPTDAARAAFGPCLLVGADAYRAVGGHAAVRGEVIEDVALARRFRAAGRPVRALAGRGVASFRMYPGGLGALVEGWSKNLARGAGGVGVPVALAAAAWVAACAAVAAGVGTGSLPPAAYLAVAAQWWWMLRRIGSFRWWAWALWPVPLAAFVALFLRSAALTVARRPVRWRGRRVAVVPAAREAET
ncbi:MAG TPA: glycosyltransferase [Acidimicrobiales bacterium]